MNKYILIFAVVLCVAVSVLLLKNQVPREESIVDISTSTATQSQQNPKTITAIFTDTSTDTSVEVQFSGQQAVFTGLSYTEVELTQATSASGARYANEDESLVVWNKGSDLTVYEHDMPVFTGSAETESQDNGAVIVGLWQWQHTEVYGEDTIEPHDPSRFTLRFTDSSQVQGTTDCNGFGGSYTYSEDTVTFGPLMMTEMYCEGSQEQEFVQPLVDTLTVRVDGDMLLLMNSKMAMRLVQVGE